MACTALPATNDRIRRNGEDAVLGRTHFRPQTTLSTLGDREELELRFRRSRWRGDPDHPGVRERLLEATLHVDGCHAGSFKLTEMRPEPLISNRQFIDWADALSAGRIELAEVILEHWENVSDVSDCGTILELTRVWMCPSFSNGRRFALAANALVDLSTERSLLVLKAFPLEYEGKASAQYERSLTRRREAMMRHYRSTLGVAPFPGRDGDDGWMYAIRPDLRLSSNTGIGQ
ncbi:hypothetical protein H7F51_09095 [Novosphingobium flavum]|uniref:Uncharacterized protein n=1 Tax=Novosphingobium flavum TaxID=1778672 RepID=A0A7X1FRV0_9SPHN|nr:hypothetical protein [Novosphingobium flavum]MBC2665679.1 hypothetical protein [Novosphingobium flavum]